MYFLVGKNGKPYTSDRIEREYRIVYKNNECNVELEGTSRVFTGSLFSAKRYASRHIPHSEPQQNIRIEIYCDGENFKDEPICTRYSRQWVLHPFIKDWDMFDLNAFNLNW